MASRSRRAGRATRRTPGPSSQQAITSSKAATIAGVVETFARAIETTRRRGFAVDPQQIFALGDWDEAEGYDETDDSSETEDCDP